jgi:hypothetical protein
VQLHPAAADGSVGPWTGSAVTLTVFDAAATAVWLELGLAIEANPLLDHLIGLVGVGLAMLFRAWVGIVLVLALAVCATESRWARRALPAVTALLGAVAMWHVVGATAALS